MAIAGLSSQPLSSEFPTFLFLLLAPKTMGHPLTYAESSPLCPQSLFTPHSDDLAFLSKYLWSNTG